MTDIGLSDDEKEALQEELAKNLQCGWNMNTELADPANIESEYEHCIVTSARHYSNIMHIPDRSTADTEPMCETGLTDGRTWVEKELAVVDTELKWCKNCRRQYHD